MLFCNVHRIILFTVPKSTYPSIYIYVCIYAYVYICMSIYMYVSVYIYMHICIYLHMYMYMYGWRGVYMCMYIHIYVHVCVYKYMYECICEYIYMYICIHMYIYMYEHLSIYICVVERLDTTSRIVLSEDYLDRYSLLTLFVIPITRIDTLRSALLNSSRSWSDISCSVKAVWYGSHGSLTLMPRSWDEHFLGLQGPSPQTFTCVSRAWFIALRLLWLFFRGMPTRPKSFLKPLSVPWLRPCVWYPQ